MEETVDLIHISWLSCCSSEAVAIGDIVGGGNKRLHFDDLSLVTHVLLGGRKCAQLRAGRRKLTSTDGSFTSNVIVGIWTICRRLRDKTRSATPSTRSV